MTDQQLLEAAARAAGLPVHDWTPTLFAGESEPRDWPHEWNPLTDDGDALRLAVHLGMTVKIATGAEVPNIRVERPPASVIEPVWPEIGAGATTRRAIVRAAAAISQQQALAELAQADRELGLDENRPAGRITGDRP